MSQSTQKTKEESPMPTIIEMAEVPLTESGEPDIAAILAANGLDDVDMSRVKIIKANKPKSA